MPKKRKRGGNLHCQKKHIRPGRAIIRMRINGIAKKIKNHFTSTEPNSDIDIGLFDIIEFEKERVELNKKKRSLFSAATMYSDCFCL